MARVLSKYSKATNQQVEYTTQIEYAKALAKDASAPAPQDLETPFTFKQWFNRNIGIAPGEEYRQYNEYLKRWYEGRYTPAEASATLKEEYIALIKQLAVVLQNEDEYKWVADIDYSDDLELADVIPFFATKLKEIAIYLANKRSSIKKAKLKYNMSGAHNAITSLFYEYLLKAFTQRDYVLNVPVQSAWNTFPELSAIKDSFQIQIQELYDNTSYFDKDPIIPASAYFNFDHPNVSAYYDNQSFNVSSLDWLYSTGFSQLCADNPLIWTLSGLLIQYDAETISELPLSAFIDAAGQELNDYTRIKLTEKYLGGDQYFMKDGYFEAPIKSYTYELQQGNNFFYWPSGEYFREIDPATLGEVSLTSSNLVIDGATGARKYEDADKIFVWDVKNDEQDQITINNLSAAWLKQSEFNTITNTMSANIAAGNNLRFRFPYPGYGLSGDGIPWSGPELSNLNNKIAYLPEESQEEIIDLYWNTVSPTSSFDPISIHNTKLIDNGAYASQNYMEADKLTVSITDNPDFIHDTNPDSVYQAEYDRAWLYKMLKTDILAEVGHNYIQWPLLKYNTGDTLLVDVLSSQCAPVAVSSIDSNADIIGARSGSGLYNSDIIYKLDAPDGFSIECAFLSGQDLNTIVPGATGTIQPNFTLKCTPGNYETFIWQGSNTILNNFLLSKKHQSDCLYLNQAQESIYNARYKTLAELGWEANGVNNYRTCDCKSIWYSPIGHPGDAYDEYDKMADIVFVDTQYPEEFDLKSWRGLDGLPYDQSVDFMWFKLIDQIEVDVGWSNGLWQTGAGTPIGTLKQGKRYKYLRANLRRNPEELFLEAVPPLIIKSTNSGLPKTQWMKASLQSDGTWAKTVSASDMIINPGDYIMYDHIDSHWFCTSAEGDFGYTPTIAASAFNEDNSIWTSYTYVTTGTEIVAQWPNDFTENGPSTLRGELTAVSWILKKDSTVIYTGTNISPEEPFIFTPYTEALYSLSATGHGAGAAIPYTTIPTVTAVKATLVYIPSGELDVITTYNDRIGMTINIDLSGWNYTTNSYDATSIGGKPVWAKAYDNNSIQTKNKGIDAFGGGIRSDIIDDYTFLSQPDLATTKLSADCFVDYSRKSTQMIWREPIEFINDSLANEWKTLLIDPSASFPGGTYESLNIYLNNINTDLVVTATDINSDLVLYQGEDGTAVNYWATNAFTWTQELTDSSLGLPPTGGYWVPPTSGSLVEAQIPYANLSNRHYPTIATAPYLGGVYSSEDSGGYFVPRMLGASTYVGINYLNTLDALRITNDINDRGLSAVFQDPEYFRSDRGLSETSQIAPISTADIDARWMKASVIENEKAGSIVNAQKYQEFIPYQAKYESSNINSNGLITQSVRYDPFTGEEDNEWGHETTWPANFRGENDIHGWYETVLSPGKIIHQWKTDIFGNSYVLVKETSATSIYEQNQTPGIMWVKDQNGRIDLASNAISAVYDNFAFSSPELSAEITNSQIRDFDIWFDTMMVQTTGHVVIERLNFDYDTNRIFSIADDLAVLNLSADNGGKFAGTWFFDEEKKVTFCTIAANGSNYPSIIGSWSPKGISTSWKSVAMTPSGGKQLAINANSLYESLDYGVTWASISNPTFAVGFEIEMSENGKYITFCTEAVVYNNLWVSDDYGTTWTAKGSINKNMYGVSMSDDGQYQLAGGEDGFFQSSDYGVTWTISPTLPAGYYFGGSISSTGKYQTALRVGSFYVSNDYGVTWTIHSIPGQGYRSAISDDGKYITVTTFGFKIYTSNDYGISFIQRDSNRPWKGMAMSSDGKYQSATVNSGQLYSSDDYGVTWHASESSRAWTDIAMSSDGVYKSATATGQIYIYNPTGGLYPILYNLDLNTNILTKEYDGSNDVQINAMSALGLSSIEDPVFTYNNLTNKFDVAFVGYGTTYQGMIITDIKINNFSGEMEIESVNSIVPTN